MRKANAEYDDADIAEINELLLADRRKIPRCLRLLRGDDLIQEAAVAAPDPDLLPTTYTKFSHLPKAVVTAAVSEMDARMTQDRLTEWDRHDRGIAWKLYHIGTGFMKNHTLPPEILSRLTMIRVSADWALQHGNMLQMLTLPGPNEHWTFDRPGQKLYTLLPVPNDPDDNAHRFLSVRHLRGLEVPLGMH